MRPFAPCVFLGLFLGLILAPASPLHAAIFKWTDDKGKVHYTNDKSKIPRKYRESGEVGTLRGSEGKSSAGSAPASASAGGKDDAILTEEELSKIEIALSFLNRERDFVSQEETSFHTPTGLRSFGNKYNSLNQDRASVKKQIEGTQVRPLNEVVSHIESALKSAEENPNWMRKLSAANTVQRLKQEVSVNGGLIDALDEAVKKSKEKAKELEEKKEAEKKKQDGNDKKAGK